MITKGKKSDFNTPLSIVGSTTIADFNNPVNQLNIYRTFCPTIAEYTFLYKCMWNILQDRPYAAAPDKLQ